VRLQTAVGVSLGSVSCVGIGMYIFGMKGQQQRGQYRFRLKDTEIYDLKIPSLNKCCVIHFII
jgi:hypothetical protein